MKRSSKYVGLDVHQATTVASVREESGRIIMRTVVPTEAGPLVEFCRGMRGRVAAIGLVISLISVILIAIAQRFSRWDTK